MCVCAVCVHDLCVCVCMEVQMCVCAVCVHDLCVLCVTGLPKYKSSS